MSTATYETRRGELEHYFDRTATKAWEQLTSDAPVSGIRATVRAGRERMRGTLLSWLPDDLQGARVLDAGCGTGALAIEAAAKGADVLAIDISPKLVAIAEQRATQQIGPGSIDFRVGDMLDPSLGKFDYVVAMDSLIHYDALDIQRVVAALSSRTSRAMVFTCAPWTPALALMHTIGKLFPKSDRAPAIKPVKQHYLRRRLSSDPTLEAWQIQRDARVTAGFYISHAQEICRS